VNEQDQQQMVMLAAIGDLEVTRRSLIMEIQARDAKIEELELELLALKDETVEVGS
jgi:hypothetical protein